MNFLQSFNIQTLLTEANVYNLDIPYGKVKSLSSQLSPIIAAVSDNSKDQLKKKLVKLIVNDPKMLSKVEDVGDDAPEWAHRAMAAGDLHYVQLDAATLDILHNIGHYVHSLENDQKSNDNNIKAVATRELAGVIKAGTIDELSQKANQYFVRGTKNADHSTEGTVPVGEVAGYRWFRLETIEAYRREGKVLQNCIGTYYTPTKSDRILVMKNQDDESVVAMRVTTKGVIQEIKGKNNRPPVDRYVEPVIAFLKQHPDYHIDTNSSYSAGASDLTAMGYLVQSNGEYVSVHKLIYAEMGSDAIKLTTPSLQKFLVVFKHPSFPQLVYYRNTNAIFDTSAPRRPSILVFSKTGHLVKLFAVNEAGKLMQAESQFASSSTWDSLTDEAKDHITVVAAQSLDAGPDETISSALRNRGVMMDVNTKTLIELETILKHVKSNTPITLSTKAIKTAITDIYNQAISDIGRSQSHGHFNYLAQRGVIDTSLDQIHQEITELINTVSSQDECFAMVIDPFPLQYTLANSEYGKKLVNVLLGVIDHNTGTLSGIAVKVGKNGELFGLSSLDNSTVPLLSSSDIKKIKKHFESQGKADIAENISEYDAPISSFTVTVKPKDSIQAAGPIVNLVKAKTDIANMKWWSKGRLAPTKSGLELTSSLLYTMRGMYRPHIIKTQGRQSHNIMVTYDARHNIAVVTEGVETALINVGSSDNITLTMIVSSPEMLNRLLSVSSTEHTPYIEELFEQNGFEVSGGSVGIKNTVTPIKSIIPESSNTHKYQLRNLSPKVASSLLLCAVSQKRADSKYWVGVIADDAIVGLVVVKEPGTFTVYDARSNTTRAHPLVDGLRALDRWYNEINAISDHHEGWIVDVSKWYTENFDVPTPFKHEIGYDTDGAAVRLLTAANAQTEPLPRTRLAAAAKTHITTGWATGRGMDYRLTAMGLLKATVGDNRRVMLSITDLGKEVVASKGKHELITTLGKRTVLRAPAVPFTVERREAPQKAPANNNAQQVTRPARTGSKAAQAQQMWDEAIQAGGVPTRAAFIRKLVDEVGMTSAGASTYYQNLKTKHARAQGVVGESLSLLEYLMYISE